MDSLPFLGVGKKDVKHFIIEILQKEGAQTTRQLFDKICTEKNVNVTYQGIHKAIKQLISQDVAVKEKREISLDKLWVKQLITLGRSLEAEHSVKKLKIKEGKLILHKNARVYFSRTENVSALAEMVDRTKSGDLLFGQSRSGFDFPKEFYEALERAATRGVLMRFIIPEGRESSEFAKFLHELNSTRIKVKTETGDYLRIFGVKNQEVMFARAFPDAYLAFHFTDQLLANYFFQEFQQCWGAKTPSLRLTRKIT
ncbi:MAG TPA: hypothetical protein VI875_00370 [Candidatus Norongarragalinales archaeon]|nr:hypothetical protein [Candidatus Norongarragalinales archaeon]